MGFKNKSLGRGLEAIFADNKTPDNINNSQINTDNYNLGREESSINSVIYLDVLKIEINENQPRKDIDENSLLELADSIAKHGVIQPILVSKIPNTENYQIIAGERRYRASRMSGLKEIPAIIKDVSNLEKAEISLIENLQREDLSPIEEAMGYKALIEEYKLTQEQVAEAVGKSRPAVANFLRLLNLPPKVIALLNSKVISFGHAKAILALNDEDEMLKYAEMVEKKGLSVRNLENIIKMNSKEKTSKQTQQENRDIFFDEVEISLKDMLGRKVIVKNISPKRGKLEIEFYSKEDLQDIISKFA